MLRTLKVSHTGSVGGNSNPHLCRDCCSTRSATCVSDEPENKERGEEALSWSQSSTHFENILTIPSHLGSKNC